ncbi:MAG: acetyltransferase [Acidaminococcaceae bacterium]|nr:acetyltransferase [Acidaminococcaceae bacterium]
MKRKLLLIGGGGHCRSVLDSVLSLSAYDEIGIVDYNKTPVAGIPVVGQDEDLFDLKANGWTDAFITVGSVGDTSLRQRLFKLITEIGFTLPSIIDSTAVVAKDVIMGKGCFIGKGAIINAGTCIDEAVIVNTGAVIEHECKIEAFAHISPGTVLCGQVTIGEHTHVGAGSVVRQQIQIGSNTLVGAGSVVVKDLPAKVKAFGNPCKVV